MRSHRNAPPPGESLEEKLLMDLRATRTAVSPVDPLPLEDVMWDLRVDSEDDAESVRRYLLGSADWMEERTGYALRPGSYQVLLDGWWQPGPVQIMKGPLRHPEELVIECMELGVAGWQPLPLSGYRVSEEPRSFRIYWREGVTFPTLEPGGQTVRIRFDAGYDPPGSTQSESSGSGLIMPDGMKSALTAITAFMYQKKVAGRDTLRFANVELDPVLQQYRQFW